MIVLVAAVLAGVAGCNSDPDEYDFNGTWNVSAVVNQSSTPLVPVGQTSSSVKTIIQDGTSFVLVADDGSRMSGTCDPKAGTFTVTDTGAVGSTLVMSGHAVDGRTLTAEVSITLADLAVHLTYTFDLLSR
jgi:hypothetical protein